MFKIRRFYDSGGFKKSWLKIFKSGTIAYMCPHCYNIIYMNGKTYSSISSSNIDDFYLNINLTFMCPFCENRVVGIELDPNIAEDISILNKKGYTTKYCCEGHISDHQYITSPYIYFNNMHYDIAKNLPKTWCVDNDYDGFIIRGDISNPKKKILEDLHKMVEKLPEVDYPITKKRPKYTGTHIEYDESY